jgi:PAS domain S-box-containing protein
MDASPRRAEFSLSDIAGSRFPLLEHAPDATVIVDNAGHIRLINAQTENLFGYYREELLGEPIEKLIPKRFRGQHVRDRSEYTQDPRVRPMGIGLELFGLRKDGSEFPVEISLSPVTLREGTFIAAAVRDVTQRKAFEAQLKELNAQLESASRAKDRFLASMSHELRTPLNAIIGFTGTLVMGLPGPLNEEQLRQLQIVQSSARHLLSLINDVLDLAKIESGKVELSSEQISLRETIDGVVASFAALAAEKELTFSARVVVDDDVVVSDRRALRQILINLTSNALKYTDRGSVCISVEATQLRNRPAVAITVADTGIGIKAEDIERSFLAFEQLDSLNTRRYEGTGLGLYVSRNLSALLGGELTVSSEYGVGSRFTFTVPRARD